MAQMSSFRFFRRKRRKPELSIAPLIDVVFLLLIFFMVTTAFTKETGVTVNKPTAAISDVLLDQNLLIAVTEEGEVWSEGRQLDLPAVRALVRERIALNAELTVVIMADTDSRTGDVVDVLDECKQAGARKLSIATRMEEGEDSGTEGP